MSNDAIIDVRDNPQASRFETTIEGHTAFAQYILADGLIIFTHTEVPPELGGRGIATQLVEAGLHTARQRGLSVLPRCSVFGRYMLKHPETHDLLGDSIKDTLGIPR
ncbi:GNAT family N-acetyltransferase [Ancylobacter lacus]|uniref:GNAT family N-acetyltransferase n=1 Tax=Ancylobacter lacus TaxID=2579970 RepID=UPI001BD08D51|nr:GNAT family N-acetyltransferase [Ancylobacter lacus]MBS7539498.1 N-acetyltransferase [Ancylobacter lacus]